MVRKSWKEFDELKNIDQKCYCSNYYDASVNKYGVKCGTSLRLFQYFCIVKNRFFNFFINIEMNYYWFNRQELLQKARKKYDNDVKEKAAKYYQDNKDVMKEKANSESKNLEEEEKEAKTQYSKNRYNKMKEK